MAQLTLQQAFDLAVQHHRAGRLRDAEEIYRQILIYQPGHANALHRLGVIAYQVGRHGEAVNLIRQAIAIRPNYPEAHCDLGNALICAGRVDEAIAAYHQAIALRPGLPEAHSNLGKALTDCGQLDEAIAACRQAIALNPNLPEAYCNLGNALTEKGQLDEAITACRQAIACQPNLPEAYGNLGNALKDRGQLDAAIAAYRQALALRPNFSEAHSNLLLALHYRSGLDAMAVAEEHRRWDQQHAQPLREFIQTHGNDRSVDRRLRIGYVSPDLRDHVVARFFLPLLERHDRQRFEIACYSQTSAPDAMTARLRTFVDHWRSLVGRTDEQAAGVIREDRIDILVDLAGHSSNNRLLVFARKPAPVQVTWLGYPNTTGLRTMDYRLTDALADPPGMTDALHTEELVRLPQTAWCFSGTDTGPAAPRADRAAITFASFNNFAKVSDDMLRTWGRLLMALPGSQLLLKAHSFGEATVQQHVREVLQAAGVTPDRVALRGWHGSYMEHLVSYAGVDIALDTFPYHGTTTTCEALWMGVPVVTLAGTTHASRVGVSLLTNVGLPEMIAGSPEEYVRIACGLAGDLPRLRELRATLRQRMEVSPLMDAPRFARHIEAAYRTMWQRYCGPS